MAKKKTYTVKGHRQIQREKEQVRKVAQEELAIITGNLKSKILDLFPELLAEQVQEALDAGFDVTIETKVSAKALMDIIRS
jgi:uncharacterized protein (DUF433 family)